MGFFCFVSNIPNFNGKGVLHEFIDRVRKRRLQKNKYRITCKVDDYLLQAAVSLQPSSSFSLSCRQALAGNENSFFDRWNRTCFPMLVITLQNQNQSYPRPKKWPAFYRNTLSEEVGRLGAIELSFWCHVCMWNIFSAISVGRERHIGCGFIFCFSGRGSMGHKGYHSQSQNGSHFGQLFSSSLRNRVSKQFFRWFNRLKVKWFLFPLSLLCLFLKIFFPERNLHSRGQPASLGSRQVGGRMVGGSGCGNASMKVCGLLHALNYAATAGAGDRAGWPASQNEGNGSTKIAGRERITKEFDFLKTSMEIQTCWFSILFVLSQIYDIIAS